MADIESENLTSPSLRLRVRDFVIGDPQTGADAPIRIFLGAIPPLLLCAYSQSQAGNENGLAAFKLALNLFLYLSIPWMAIQTAWGIRRNNNYHRLRMYEINELAKTS